MLVRVRGQKRWIRTKRGIARVVFGAAAVLWFLFLFFFFFFFPLPVTTFHLLSLFRLEVIWDDNRVILALCMILVASTILSVIAISLLQFAKDEYYEAGGGKVERITTEFAVYIVPQVRHGHGHAALLLDRAKSRAG